jgi:hypothetical protein
MTGRKRSRASSESGDRAEAHSPCKEEVTALSSVDSVCGAWQAAATVAGASSRRFWRRSNRGLSAQAPLKRVPFGDALTFAHVLFGKPVPTPDQVRGRLFPGHALSTAVAADLELVRAGGFEPPVSSFQGRQGLRAPLHPDEMDPAIGFEPTSSSFVERCSSTELRGAVGTTYGTRTHVAALRTQRPGR